MAATLIRLHILQCVGVYTRHVLALLGSPGFDMSSFGDPRPGLLLALRSLLRAIGVLREQIAEDLTE